MDILTEIERFLEAHSMAPATFGKLALNDPPFVSQLRAGRRLWPETEARVRSWMAEYATAAKRAA